MNRAPKVVRRSLLLKHAVFFFAVVIPVTGLIGWAAYVSALNMFDQQIQDRLVVIARMRGAEVQAYQSGQRKRIATVAARPRLRSLLQALPSDTHSAERFRADTKALLIDLQSANSELQALCVADVSGTVVAATDDTYLGQSVEQFVQVTQGHSDSYLGDPYVEGDRYLAQLAAPIRTEEGRLLGVLTAVLDVTPIEQMLADTRGLGLSGEVLIARAENTHAYYLFPPRDSRASAVPLASVPAMQRAIDGRTGWGTNQYQGVEVVAAYQPLGEVADENASWGLVAKLDADEAYAPITRLRTMLLLLEAVILIGAAALSMFMARRLTRPILELVDTAVTLATGNLGARVKVQSRDEIGVLGTAFNQMAGQLERSYALLEQRVEERTGELAEANTELEREIADRKQAEQSRAEAIARLQSVLDAATQVSIIATDLNGVITVFNSGAERMLGYTAEEMVGKLTPEMIHLVSEIVERGSELSREVGYQVEGFDVFVTLARRHGFERREWTYVRKGGGHLTVSLIVTAVRDFAGQVIGFLGVAEDVTERKCAEQALHEAKEKAEAANQAKSAFLANMSHEIRTPMNAIIGMTELVLDTRITPEQREFLSCVSESADTLLAVVNDILDFSKIEAGKLVFEPTVFNLKDCVGDTIRSLGIRAHEKELELAYHVRSGAPELVVGDRIRLRQILLNLVGNAIKFTDVGEVVVEVDSTFPSDAEAELHFTVKDTGIGIPKDKQSAIFGVFEQADNTTTRRYGGTGLGLAISSRLVEMMGGRLALQSEEGFGSTFTFTVRVGRVDEKTQDIQSIRTTHLSGVRALVVDDNATNRRILQETLGNWSMDVVTASGVSEALLAMRHAGNSGRPFRLVVTDCHMPGEDGFALAQAIKCDQLLNTSVIMMLTSGDHPDDSSRCRQMGISAHLLKPVKQTELFNAISLALGQNAPHVRVSEQAARRSADGPRPLKILLAEDSLVNQKLAVALLEKRGHNVAVACNGKQAVEKVSSEDFDLVLMDVQMPEMDGLEATIAIRAHQRQNVSRIPIIALTAHAMKGDRQRCLQAGMDAYVSKPVRADQLFETIEAVVGFSPDTSRIPSPHFSS